MHLEFQHEITSKRFAEVGRPYRLFRDTSLNLVAICSALDLICWPGRGSYEGQKLHHRVSLYSASTFDLIAVLDVNFPVNDLAFHPTEAQIAIGTGDYDGGFYFHGELLLWNWKPGTSQSLLGEWRQVVRCRFNKNGALALLLRPRDEEEFEDPDPFQTYLGVVLDDLRPASEIFPVASNGDPRLADLQPDDPAKWGFGQPASDERVSLPAIELEHLQTHGYHEQYLIWDLLWLSDETFVVAHQACQAELWHLNHGCQAAFHGEGHGVELLPHHETGCLVHVLQRADWIKRSPDLSSLYWLREGSFSLVHKFGHCCSFSSDAIGNILARDTGDYMRRERTRKDSILDSNGKTLLEADLGGFDCFNHSLRLNGGHELYYLRGNPATSHRNKALWQMSADGITHQSFTWDASETHMMSGLASFVRDDQIIRACEIYDPKRSGRSAILELLSLPSGESLWKTSMQGCFTALVVVREKNCAVFSLTNGDIGLVDLSSGQILAQFTLAIDGVATIAMALAVRHDQLLIGTIDGRLLMYRFSRSR